METLTEPVRVKVLPYPGVIARFDTVRLKEHLYFEGELLVEAGAIGYVYEAFLSCTMFIVDWDSSYNNRYAMLFKKVNDCALWTVEGKNIEFVEEVWE